MSVDLHNRRPVRARSAGWAQACAGWLARRSVSPDAVSGGAVGCAALGAAAFLAAGATGGPARVALLVAAAAAVQGRLVCNLLDGLVAVEHGRGGPHGPIWNELPDRVADILLLAGAGYGAARAGASWGVDAGWAAAALAVVTAYVRELGRALGAPADFSGPGAKPQRMALLTAAALLATAEPLWDGRGRTLAAALGLIAFLAALTAALRTRRLAARLSAARARPTLET